MAADERKPDPLSLAICGLAALATFVISVVFIPAAELLPAQVYPEKRESGESCVRIPEIMNQYGAFGLTLLDIAKSIKQPISPKEKEESKADVVQLWQDELVKINGEKYGKDLAAKIPQSLGGEQNLKVLLELMHLDKNYVYNAYALFLGLALFAGAVAIQAMGRWGAEEKTILPAKK